LDSKSKAQIHKNLTKAYEILCNQQYIDVKTRLKYFKKMIKNVSQALHFGVGCMEEKWV
jgi:hypothetical protein